MLDKLRVDSTQLHLGPNLELLGANSNCVESLSKSSILVYSIIFLASRARRLACDDPRRGSTPRRPLAAFRLHFLRSPAVFCVGRAAPCVHPCGSSGSPHVPRTEKICIRFTCFVD